MANPEHVEVVNQGTGAIAAWQVTHLGERRQGRKSSLIQPERDERDTGGGNRPQAIQKRRLSKPPGATGLTPFHYPLPAGCAHNRRSVSAIGVGIRGPHHLHLRHQSRSRQ